MEISHGSRMEYEGTPVRHRSGGISFKTLLIGKEHTPENYTLNIARQDEFSAPVHHHNFDQFRYALKGDVSLGPNTLLKQGHLSYHPEGTYYGPQKDEPGSVKIVLLLQCGGASGQGYMSFSTLMKANSELAEVGKFEGGKYYSSDGSVKDGYQASWEHANGRKLVYPKARYHAPIIMNPDSFAWIPADERVWKRTLGVFSERELRAEQIKIDQGGSVMIGDENAISVAFVLAGHGRVGDEQLVEESCISLEPRKTATIHVESEEMVLLRYVMPLLQN